MLVLHNERGFDLSNQVFISWQKRDNENTHPFMVRIGNGKKDKETFLLLLSFKFPSRKSKKSCLFD